MRYFGASLAGSALAAAGAAAAGTSGWEIFGGALFGSAGARFPVSLFVNPAGGSNAPGGAGDAVTDWVSVLRPKTVRREGEAASPSGAA